MSKAMYVSGASIAASRSLLLRLLGRKFPTAEIGYYSVSEVLENASDEDKEALTLLIDRARRAPGKSSMPRSVVKRGETAVHFSATFAESIMSSPDTSILAIHPSGRIIGMAHTELASGHVLDYNRNLFGLADDEPVVEFGRLFVLSDYRGLGIAHQLFIDSIVTMIEDSLPIVPVMFFIVETENEESLEFFSRYGDFVRKHLNEDDTEHIVTFDDTDHYQFVIDVAEFIPWYESYLTEKYDNDQIRPEIVVSSDYDVLFNVLDKNGFSRLRHPEELESGDAFEDEAGHLVSTESVNIVSSKPNDDGTIPEDFGPLVSINEGELYASPHALISAYDAHEDFVHRRADTLHLSDLVVPHRISASKESNNTELTISKFDDYRSALDARLALESEGEELTRNISTVDYDGLPVSFRVVHRKAEGEPTYPVRYPVRRVRTLTEGPDRKLYAISSTESGVSIIVNGYVLHL